MSPCKHVKFDGTILDMNRQANIGQSLRSLRKFAGLTLDDIAQRSGCAASYLSKVETGKLTPADSFVARVATAVTEALNERTAAA